MAVAASFWVWELLQSGRLPIIWTVTGLTALVVAAPQVAWQSLANGNGTGGHLALGWTVSAGENILTFWANNYGLTGIIIIALFVTLIARRSLRKYIVWYAPFVAVLVLANVYSMQPFAFDNVKLILYVYLVTYIFAGYGVIWLVKRHKLTLIPVVIIAVVLIASGFLGVLREFEHMDLFASSDDISLASWAKTATLPADTFLTADAPNQPLATLAGRSIVLGYRGWLYNFHINYQPRTEAVMAAMSGTLTARNPYHARYLAISSYDSANWNIDQTAIQANYELVYSNPSWKVFRLPGR
jgi:hypothetical protein